MTRAHELRTRKDYLQTLVDWDADPAANGMVRVISGVRRSGKSSLLELYKQHVGSEKVVSVNFEDFSTLGLREAQRFHEEMTARIAATGATHLHVDEVQELDDWSQVINSLRLHENLTITVTGSNASMFVGEGLTYLAGRYIQLEMFPLSLHEYSSFAPEAPSQPSARYAEWMRGTLPAAAQAGSPKIRREINNAIFDSIFARDIALRGAIKDPDIFMRVARFVFDNVGSQLSSHKIANYLTSAGAKRRNQRWSGTWVFWSMRTCSIAVTALMSVGKRISKAVPSIILSTQDCVTCYLERTRRMPGTIWKIWSISSCFGGDSRLQLEMRRTEKSTSW